MTWKCEYQARMAKRQAKFDLNKSDDQQKNSLAIRNNEKQVCQAARTVLRSDICTGSIINTTFLPLLPYV